MQQSFARLQVLFARGIWQSDVLSDRSMRGRWFAALRVASMTWSGIFENNLWSRAGALSYSSMLGMGPLVALIVLFSGVVLERTDPDFAIQQLNKAIETIAPQMRLLTEPTASSDGAVPNQVTTTNSEIGKLLRSFIQGSRSKTIGVMGALSLIVIVIQLFTTIETSFNGIWGVRRGRNWMLRIIFYWAAVTLGAVLAFTALTLLSASTFVTMLDNVPLGPEIRGFFRFMGPLISGVVLAGLLTVFYKFIPNTSVGWWPAFAGAVLAVLLVNLNNFLAFLYIRNIALNNTLYGSLGVIPILMFGLYVFWLFLLLGGQITYAVQNANYRSSHMAWADLNHRSREGLALLVLTLVARRFRNCNRAYSSAQIAERIKIPIQILNACLERLIQLGFVSRIPPDDNKASLDYCFQPARPLDRISLREFKESFEGYGEGPSNDILGSLDPVVRQFFARMEEATRSALADETLESVVDRLPGGNGSGTPTPSPA